MADADDAVSGWLRSADLSYAIPNFRMAGIVSPRSFAELELAYFEPLGVSATRAPPYPVRSQQSACSRSALAQPDSALCR